MWPWKSAEQKALKRILSDSWKCSSCEEEHNGLFDLACPAPDPWGQFRGYQSNSELILDGDFLSEDFCVLNGEHFIVRCVLEIPVHGLADKFAYGVWGSLKKENFDLYVKHFDEGTPIDGAPFWSWLLNRPKPFDIDEPLGCWMMPQIDRQRPTLKVDDETHPLSIAQNEGVSALTLFDMYEANGHPVA